MSRRVTASDVTLGIVLIAGGALLLYAGRHLTFFFDEWDFILRRRGGSVGTYLDPHNGHLALFPVVVYKILFALVGLRHYVAYQLVLVALHLVSCGLLYALTRRRLGRWLALVPVVLLLFMGSAFQDLLWPFQIGFLASVAGGLLALLSIEVGTRRADALAATALIWSLTGSAVGVPFLVAAAVMLLCQRSRPSRLWVVVLPAVLFAIWYVGWGGGEQVTSDSVLGAPQYVADAAAGAAAGIAGLSSSWGPVLAGAFAVLCGLALARRQPVRPLLIAATVGVLCFWSLSAIARADYADPAASRYLYIGAAFIMLIAAESFAGRAPRPGWALVGAVVLAGCLLANINLLRSGERGLRGADTAVRAGLAAVQIAAPVVSSSFQPEPANAPQITAGPYLAAERALGSPALTPAQLEAGAPSVAAHADHVLEEAERLAPTPLTGPTSPRGLDVTAVFGAGVTRTTSCLTARPNAPLASIDLRVSPGGQLLTRAVKGTLTVYLRRLAPAFADNPPLATLAAGSPNQALRFPVDAAPEIPWNVQLVDALPFTVCAG